MYSLSQICHGLEYGRSNPWFFAQELNRLFHRRFYRRDYNPRGVDVIAEDWDVLVILDACRFDLFETVSNLPGRLERRRSRGSHTVDFLMGNFSGRNLDDLVYVTASPQFHRQWDRINATIHQVINVWQDGWNDEHNTVLPETMEEHALTAADRHPDKRLMVHFMQPHYPFIGADSELNPRHPTRPGETKKAPDIWGLLRQGDASVSVEQVWRAYRENLERALLSVKRLFDELEGRIVVTSDHGNMLGERAFPIPIREWGHPRGIYTDKLVSVPWLVYESGPRRRVVSGSTASGAEAAAEEVVTDRLEKLGYVE